MGSKRYFENTCDACGATATVGTGDFRLNYKKPEDPDQLAAWIEWNNWHTTTVDWRGADGEITYYSQTTCPRCTWEDIKDLPVSRPDDELF